MTKEQKCYYQGRWFNGKKEFEEWVLEFNDAIVSPHSLHNFLYDFTQQIDNNHHIIKKELTNSELRSVFETLFEVYIKEVR